jgi:hypothetical protein
MNTGSLSPFGCTIATKKCKFYQIKITKYSKKYPVNATAQIEQVQDKKTSNGTAKKYY